MRQWTDERVPQGLLEHNFSIINRDWEASIAVDRNAIEDEQYGQVEIRVKELAVEAVRFFDELAFGLISQGQNTSGSGDYAGVDIRCYDGKAFFATNHSEGDSGSQSNRGSTALGSSALKTVISLMKKLKNDKGKPAHVKPNLMVAPLDLEWEAKELLNSDFYPEEGSTTAKLAKNVLKGALDLLVTDYLSDSDNWYVFDTNRVVKPLILQLRQNPRFSSLTQGTESSFMRKKLYFGVDWRGEILFSDWRTGYASIVG
jgi:phage major head subunit gpT-like protein